MARGTVLFGQHILVTHSGMPGLALVLVNSENFAEMPGGRFSGCCRW